MPKLIGRPAARAEHVGDVYQEFLTQLAAADGARIADREPSHHHHDAMRTPTGGGAGTLHDERAHRRALIAAQLTNAYATLTLAEDVQSVATSIDDKAL